MRKKTKRKKRELFYVKKNIKVEIQQPTRRQQRKMTKKE